MNKLPLARNRNLLIQNTGKEILIYDLSIDKAYCLNETSAIVYKACNGQTTFEDLKITHQFTDNLIYLTLDELRKLNFLESASTYVSPFAGMNRREVVRRVGLATMIALPIISGLSAPTSVRAASGGGGGCTTGTQSFEDSGTCTSNCFNCQCARDYCEAYAAPCCSGNPYTVTNYNGLRIFCNC